MGIATARPCCCIATRQNWSKRSVASWCGTRNNRLLYPKIHSTRNPTRNGTGLDSHNAPETRWRAPLGAIGPRCHHRGRTPPPAPTGSRRPPRVHRAGGISGRIRAGPSPSPAPPVLSRHSPPPPPSPSSAPPHRLQKSASARLGLSNCADRMRYHWPSSKVAWKSRPSSLGRFFTDFIAAPGMKIADQESGFKVK